MSSSRRGNSVPRTVSDKRFSDTAVGLLILVLRVGDTYPGHAENIDKGKGLSIHVGCGVIGGGENRPPSPLIINIKLAGKGTAETVFPGALLDCRAIEWVLI